MPKPTSPNSNGETINEVILNGDVILSTRGNTVTPDTLVQGEIAQMNTGESITGELDPVSHEELNELKEQVDALDEEAYKLSDEEGEISENDYIPFNDASDGNKPKKKFALLSLIEKMKDFFLPTKSDNSELSLGDYTLNLKSLDIDASKADNNVSSITYPSTSNIVDKDGRIIMRTETVVNPNGNIGWKAYVRNYDTNGDMVAQKGLQFDVDKSGNITYTVDDSRAFRKAIQTIDQLGTSLPTGTVIDNYHTDAHTGTYYFADDTVASGIVTLPEAICGKLIVTNNGNGGFSQYYIPNHSVKIWVRVWWSNAWSTWKDITSGGGDSKPHTYEMGTAIPANSDINNYTTEGVYYVSGGTIAETISNLPIAGAGKLIVMDRDTGARLFQIFIASSNNIYIRDMDNAGVFYAWKNISRSHTFELGEMIPSSSDLNSYKTEGVYYVQLDTTASTISNVPVIRAGKLIVARTTSANTYLIQTYYANASTDIYVRWYNPNGDSWSAWENLSRSHSFELGTDIPANSDLNTYITDGVYRIAPDATAQTISNSPVTTAGKLIVMGGMASSPTNVNLYKIQFYFQFNGTNIYRRNTSNGGSTWSDWVKIATMNDISPANVGNGYAVASVSGSAITATISGFQLRAGVIVGLAFSNEVAVDCTINISSTGAKGVRYWADQTISAGKSIKTGLNTFMYDGTYYRLISIDRTPVIKEQSYVADTSGNVIIDWGYGVNIAQIKFNLASNKLLWNYRKNSSWRGDVYLADYYDIVHQTLGTTIPNNANLNTYTTKGIYNIDTNAKALTISNRPCDKAGKLVVEAVAGANYICQIYNTYDNATQAFDGVHRRTTYDGGTNWTPWMQFAMINGNNKYLYLENTTTTAEDKDTGISMAITDTTTGKRYHRAVIRAFQDHQADPYGLNMVIDSGGSLFLGSGEAGISQYSAKKPITSEHVYITSDQDIYLQANANTIANRIGFVLDANGNLIPCKADVKTDNIGSIGWSDRKLANVYTYKVSDIDFHRLGQIRLPAPTSNTGEKPFVVASGSYQPYKQDTIVNLLNEIRFTNGCYGSINLGTAYTKDYSTIPTGWYNYFYIPHRYGGEVGTSPTTYESDNVNYGTLLLYGMNNTNGMFRIRMQYTNSAVSITELEDLQKGNIYVGTCTTGASERAKIATVDGNFVLRKGVRVAIKFTNSNTYSSSTSNPITLNVNSTGAKNIWGWSTHSGAGNTGTNTTFYGSAGRYANYYYDGTYWVWDGQSGDNDGNNRKAFYGTCSTAGDQKDKVVTISDTNGWELRAGTIVGVYFSNTNTYSATAENKITLNVNSSGAKTIRYNTGYQTGTSTNAYGYAGRVQFYMYDGTNWCWISAGVEIDTDTNDHINSKGVVSAETGTTRPAVSGLTMKNAYNNGYPQTYGNVMTMRGTGDTELFQAWSATSGACEPIYFRSRRDVDSAEWSMWDMAYSQQFSNVFFCTCSTAGDQQIKVASTSVGHIRNLVAGIIVGVKFSNTNSYNATADNKVQLNVDGTGAKPIYYWQGYPTGTNTAAGGTANRVHYYMYDGTNWVFVSMSGDANDNNRKSFYGTCSTEAGTSAKVVTLSDTNGWELRAGTLVAVKFSNSNTASNVTLNVNGSGAKSIYYNTAVYTGTSNAVCGVANRVNTYIYNGSQWVFINNGLVEADTFTSARCDTASATSAKTATCQNYVLLSKSMLHIIMSNANTAKSALTLNVNGKGAKPIYINGSASSASNYTLPAGSYLIYYNGTNYYFRTDGKITCAGTVTV